MSSEPPNSQPCPEGAGNDHSPGDAATAADQPRPKPGLPGSSEADQEPREITCQICDGATVPGLDLGHQPISDLLVSPAMLQEPETTYPMRLHHCRDCGLTQLGYIVDPEEVFRNFPFVSGTTATATEHLQSLPRELVERGGLDRDSFAVDIGSNDGTLLEGYLPYGVRFLGVDPAGDPVRVANEKGIDTLHAFFNAETAEYVLEEHGPADAVSAAGVFAHIDDLDGVMTGVRRLLAAGGIFASDNQYWLDMVERLHYDNVFHQHLRYYSLRPLIRLFDQYGMEVFDVSRSEVYGGSIRVFACHAGDYPRSSRVDDLLAEEEETELYRAATWERFRESVEERRRSFFDRVYRLASSGTKVVGIGAPAKASTVCNYCDIGPWLVDYITEINPLRIGKYLPGVHIPIVAEERMFEDDPAPGAGILFAWNYYDEVVPKLRKRGFEGEILQP